MLKGGEKMKEESAFNLISFCMLTIAFILGVLSRPYKWGELIAVGTLLILWGFARFVVYPRLIAKKVK